jgi:hypothetical protein
MTGVVAAGAPELQARLNGFVRENRLPGAAAGVVHGDGFAWGELDLDDPRSLIFPSCAAPSTRSR